MSVATSPASVLLTAPNPILTYAAYLEEKEVNRRYDIIDGVRELMATPKWWHQRIIGNLMDVLRDFERTSATGYLLCSPYDVLIARSPLRTRQPDLFFVTKIRLTGVGDYTNAGVLEVAPELVVEIISDSETETRFNDKVTDYQTVGVRECWKVMNETQTVEVLTLTETSRTSVATYGIGETIQSVVFPALTVEVGTIFAE